jgi:hypothetical protein
LQAKAVVGFYLVKLGFSRWDVEVTPGAGALEDAMQRMNHGSNIAFAAF